VLSQRIHYAQYSQTQVVSTAAGVLVLAAAAVAVACATEGVIIAPIISIQTSFILLFAISLFYLLRIEMVSLFLVYNVPFSLALALALSRSMTVKSEPSPSSL
jgi:hypothetical protein